MKANQLNLLRIEGKESKYDEYLEESVFVPFHDNR